LSLVRAFPPGVFGKASGSRRPPSSGRNLHPRLLRTVLVLDIRETESWKSDLLRFREEKDRYFLQDGNSPLPSSQRHSLAYFGPDPSLRYEVRLNRYESPESLIMTTSKGTRQLFVKVGWFELEIGGTRVKLTAYRSAEREDPGLFIPFRDGTSGKESYGAARYLDLAAQHDDQYAVDFNYAYNPYCAYSDEYVCPLPPNENWLSVPIRAGEKKYHD
jgi:uncharacterized protein